ncbi:sugar phosphate isomerase/epimerase family protein [Paenibacillus aestuarii]|uniref:Sugar phosphate isomerase/epimerase n=1 Tax=Paenibacillus aestuarii TaxID=516965 RepID=A0ABW0KJC9_9BACL|nr:sugar phosphate isomerase/epimerase [Paenibacillus aestuarii]
MDMYAFGWCSGIERAEALKQMGFDYIECALASLNLENDGEFAEKLPLYVNSPIPVRAFNIFFPGDLKVVGPDVDDERVRRYVHKAAKAIHQIGAETVVLGSGRSRNCPEGWEMSRAEEQILQLLEQIGEAFVGTGAKLVIEPLNKKESNIINSVSEAVRLAQMVNHPNIRVLADFYHMDEEGEPLQTLIDNKIWLQHIHIADTGRFSPGTGQYPYEQFVPALRAAGYEGMISAECTVREPDVEMPVSLAFMRRTFGGGSAEA